MKRVLLGEEALRRWGEVVGRQVRAPVFLGLRGPLGAGKSVLARAIARGAGVRGNLPSLTFNLLFRYPSARDGDVVHLDLYRVSDPEEVWELGWEELVREGGGDLVLVEWPERAEPHLPADRWEVRLEPVVGDPLLRRVGVTRVGTPPPLPPFPLTVDRGGGAS
ncbi:MAG: tRNA (adenosine(37)-N6)-threonylcarbamoyltransferase complex ATPase subunit type 1 TsaE [Longimicrobiales bacterium]|nr:tRNA (adenosine(37)-N6)-threonylcarbamoyltransferase complex ATPase subunit type 1 TsaE [Longimicrobiales bacterium]